MRIPFCKPYLTGKEFEYLKQVTSYSGDGFFTKACHQWLEKNCHISKALLTHSCTAALEMSALLIDIQPGDEIIMPSFTFVSTANAFVLRGGVPVFVDIRLDTLNLDETLVEAAITSKTKAIVPVHYAGVACEMDSILKVAKEYNLFVIEDAAQGLMAKYKGKALGSLGHFGTLSFHATKNIISGEGGSLLINDSQFNELAEIIREKGTNRSQFFRGQVDKYTWQHVGSSYLPSELNAAFLYAQLEEAEGITQHRLSVWNLYHQAFESLEKEGLIKRPSVPQECEHNAHLYYLLINDKHMQAQLIRFLNDQGIQVTFHYVPLHSSPAGKKYTRSHSSLPNTETVSDALIRLPLYTSMNQQEANTVIEAICEILTKKINIKEKVYF